jgi:hypothetical protein
MSTRNVKCKTFMNETFEGDERNFKFTQI